MALEEHDREDLLGDGRMMPVRGETEIDGLTVLCGFRSEGQVSIYFGSERVFQFDRRNQLRRVYLDGQRFAAQQGTLVELVRARRGGRLELRRDQVDGERIHEIIDCLQGCLAKIATSMCVTPWQTVGLTPPEFAERIDKWLGELPDPIQIAHSPHA